MESDGAKSSMPMESCMRENLLIAHRKVSVSTFMLTVRGTKETGWKLSHIATVNQSMPMEKNTTENGDMTRSMEMALIHPPTVFYTKVNIGMARVIAMSL